MAKTCEGCKYWRPIAKSTGAIKCCCYCIVTGNLRGGTAKDCKVKVLGEQVTAKYKPRKVSKKGVTTHAG